MGFSRQEHWSGVPLPSLGSLDGSFAIQWLTSNTYYTYFSLGSIYRSVRKPDIYFQANNGCQSSFPKRLTDFITGVLGKDRNPNWQLLAHLLHPSKFQRNIERVLWLWLWIKFFFISHSLTITFSRHHVITEGHIHSLLLIKSLNISIWEITLDNILCKNKSLSRLVNFSFLYQLGFLSLRIKRK